MGREQVVEQNVKWEKDEEWKKIEVGDRREYW